MRWIKGPSSAAHSRDLEPRRHVSSAPVGVPAEYRSLHKYLVERFADIVVLRFAEIEDLLGFVLPPAAGVQSEWWAAGDAGGTPSAQASAWIMAHRIATPNLTARTVAFERAPA